MATAKTTTIPKDSVRPKSKNWTAQEIDLLVSRCVENNEILTSSHSGVYFDSEKKKSIFWLETASLINSQGYHSRSVSDCKRKWVDMKSLTKKKQQHLLKAMNETGGGPPPPPLLGWEEKIISIMPQATLEGITGRGDTFKDRRMEEKSEPTKSEGTPNDAPAQKDHEALEEIQHADAVLLVPCPPPSKKRKRQDGCNCSSDLLNIQKQLLEESRRRNEILTDINKNMAALVTVYKNQADLSTADCAYKSLFEQ